MYQEINHAIEGQGWAQQLEVLSTQELRSLNQFFDLHQNEFQAAGIGPAKERNVSIRGDYTLWIDPLHPPAEFQKIISVLENLKQSLNESFYLGLKQFEGHLAFYPTNYFYQKHLDTFESGSTRKFSFIFYLHEHWSDGDGGELVLYDKQGKILKTIQPLPGSLVGFLADEFPHEVKICHRERRSFTGWMHTKLLY